MPFPNLYSLWRQLGQRSCTVATPELVQMQVFTVCLHLPYPECIKAYTFLLINLTQNATKLKLPFKLLNPKCNETYTSYQILLPRLPITFTQKSTKIKLPSQLGLSQKPTKATILAALLVMTFDYYKAI
jgi:hypothetical protein